MKGRVRLIRSASSLQQEKVNGYQWNWSSGLGRPGDAPPHTSKKKGKKAKHAKKRVVVRKQIGKPGRVKPYQCTQCQRAFATVAGRDAHFRDVHASTAWPRGKKSQTISAGVGPITRMLNSSAAMQSRLSNSVRDRVDHIIRTHVPCDVCGQVVGRQELKQHMRRAHFQWLGKKVVSSGGR